MTHPKMQHLKFALIVGKALKTENGCDTCMACGYSKCDKHQGKNMNIKLLMKIGRVYDFIHFRWNTCS